MDELVSRQAILVVVKYALMAWSYMPEWRDEKILEAIAELPPIQPEIVRCKDCEHGVLDDGFPHQYFCVFKGDEWNNADYFCGHAKRREVTT